MAKYKRVSKEKAASMTPPSKTPSKPYKKVSKKDAPAPPSKSSGPKVGKSYTKGETKKKRRIH